MEVKMTAYAVLKYFSECSTANGKSYITNKICMFAEPDVARDEKIIKTKTKNNFLLKKPILLNNNSFYLLFVRIILLLLTHFQIVTGPSETGGWVKDSIIVSFPKLRSR